MGIDSGGTRGSATVPSRVGGNVSASWELGLLLNYAQILPYGSH
jgi:hypothetical protein